MKPPPTTATIRPRMMRFIVIFSTVPGPPSIAGRGRPFAFRWRNVAEIADPTRISEISVFPFRQEAGLVARRIALWGLALGLALACGVRDARAQEAEELLPTISGGAPGAEPGFTSLGRSPGASGLPFENVPGFGESLLGGRPGPAFPRVPSLLTNPGGGFRAPSPRGIG